MTPLGERAAAGGGGGGGGHAPHRRPPGAGDTPPLSQPLLLSQSSGSSQVPSLTVHIFIFIHGGQEVKKRCRQSWLTNSLVYELKCGGRGGVAGSQPMIQLYTRSPNKLWRSNSIFNLWRWGWAGLRAKLWLLWTGSSTPLEYAEPDPI